MTSASTQSLLEHLKEIAKLIDSFREDNLTQSLLAVAEDLQAASHCAYEADLLGLHDTCLLLHQLLLDENNSVNLSEAQQFIHWPNLVYKYIDLPNEYNAKKILDILKLDCWSTLADDMDLSEIQEMLIIDQAVTDNSKIEKQQTSTTIFQQIEEIIHHEEIDKVDTLAKLLNMIDILVQSTDAHSSNFFQDTCLILNENIDAFIQQIVPLTKSQHTLLIACIALAKEYMIGMSKNETANALILNLQDQQWPLPLTSEDTGSIKDMLNAELQIDTAGDHLGQLSPEMTENVPKRSTLIAQTKEALDQYDDLTNADLKEIIQCIEKLNDYALNKELHGFCDTCLLILQNLNDISDEEKLLTQAQLETLQQWLVLADSYTQNPADLSTAASLIETMTAQHWPSVFTQEDVECLKDTFGISEIKTAATATDTIADANSIKKGLFDELKLTIDTYRPEQSGALTQIVAHVHNLSSDSNIQNSNHGFQDVYCLLQDNLETILHDEQELSEDQHNTLRDWINNAEKYFADQNNPDVISALINSMRKNCWASPLPESDATIIKEIFNLDIDQQHTHAHKQNTDTDTTIGINELPTSDNDTSGASTAYDDMNMQNIDTDTTIGINELPTSDNDTSGASTAYDDMNTQNTDIEATIAINKLPTSDNDTSDASTAYDNMNMQNIDIDTTIAINELSTSDNDTSDASAVYDNMNMQNIDIDTTIAINKLPISDNDTGDTSTAYDNMNMQNTDIEPTIAINKLPISDNDTGDASTAYDNMNMQNTDIEPTDTDIATDATSVVNELPTSDNDTGDTSTAYDDMNMQNTDIDTTDTDRDTASIVSKQNIEISLPADDLTESLHPDHTDDISVHPTPISPVITEMLLSEIESITTIIEETIKIVASEDTDHESRNNAIDKLARKFERFGNACQAGELMGLHQASILIHENIIHLITDQPNTIEILQYLLASWPLTITKYLSLLGDEDSSKQIIEILTHNLWHKPLIADISPRLMDLLNAPYFSTDTNQNIRQTEATGVDVSIALPADLNQALLEGLLQELPAQVEGLSSAIQQLANNDGNDQHIKEAQRIAHTVKGAANTVGISGLANLTHHLEDIFQFLAQHQKLPTLALSSSLIDASDCLEAMTESLMTKSEPPKNALSTFQNILDWINRLEQEGIEILDSADPIPKTTAPTNDVEDTSIAKNTVAETIPTVRVNANIIDDLIRLLGETIILTNQLQERITHSANEHDNLIEQNEACHKLVTSLDKHIELHSLSAVQRETAKHESFDSLEFEQFNELNTLNNQLTEKSLDAVELSKKAKDDFQELTELLIQQTRLNSEIQELAMQTRMVPIKNIASRLQRSVRQTCRNTGKQAILSLNGVETQIDSDILDDLIDPLIHMLRNAIDHGIEDTKQRIRAGKNSDGIIKLSFSSIGREVIIRCEDDGAGLNYTAILKKAVEHGLIDGHEKPDEDELNKLILMHGFSSSNNVTQTSGRGVGLDIINANIIKNKGTLHIHSQKGKGCLFEVRLPVTLISSNVLMIKQKNQIIALSNRGIEKILHPSDCQIIKSKDGLIRKVHDKILEAVNVAELLGLPVYETSPNNNTPALLIRSANINKVIYVQEIIGNRELVVKPLGKYFTNVPGLLGATILGDGSVVPVFDIPDLLLAPSANTNKLDAQATHNLTEHKLPEALVVDDSLSARRALSQTVQDAGYTVTTAKDGIEAAEIIAKARPDILLVDMEMPRMNGLELTEHIRAHKKTSKIPVIMVTSRTTIKHQTIAKQAGVNICLGKPFSENELLDHIVQLLT